ncbi:MAG: SpoIIE family protein phosphatase, partial [Solirubrobacterales bacterium]|nr:SpoIIE family protein phosphatase [Solirubrobacterales bacterium]
FRWATAGPVGPLLAHPDGTLEPLHPVATPCAGSPALRLPAAEAERRLEPGQRLLLVSDGALDSVDANGHALGLDGLRDALRRSAGRSAAVTVHELERTIHARSVDSLMDDVALVVLAPHQEKPSFY